MKYASVALLISSLLSAASAITYVKPEDVNPKWNYVLTMERDGQLYALQSKKDKPATKKIDADFVADVRMDNDVRWKFPHSIPEDMGDMSGWVYSTETHGYLGWLQDLEDNAFQPRTNVDAKTSEYYLGRALSHPDGSVTVQIGGADIGYDGKIETGATWKLTVTTGEWVDTRRRSLPRRGLLDV